MKKIALVIAVALTALLCSGCYTHAEVESKIDAAYNRGYEQGQTDAIEDIADEIPDDVLARHYFNLVEDTNFIMLYSSYYENEEGLLPFEILSRYICQGEGDYDEVVEALFGTWIICDNMMEEFESVMGPYYWPDAYYAKMDEYDN